MLGIEVIALADTHSDTMQIRAVLLAWSSGKACEELHRGEVRHLKPGALCPSAIRHDGAQREGVRRCNC